jgi:DNA polymerase family A
MEQIRNLKDGFNELTLKLWPILAAASARGIPIDREERDNLIIYLENERTRIYKEIQNKVPDEIRKIHPVNGYVRTPQEVQELTNIYNRRVGEVRQGIQAQGKKVKTLDEFISDKTYSAIVKAGEDTKIWGKLRFANFNVVDKELNELVVGRWCRVEDFNPNSSKQIIRYIKFRKHKVPVKLTGEETSDAKELERLAISTKDIFYDQIIEYRQINKMLTNDIPNWSPDEQTGAVHTTFGFYSATGQLTSRSPNVQNANKHKPLGKRFRRIVRARSYRDGRHAGRRRRLVEVDYSGFHAIMLGREAQSERYINISRVDAHSWFTSHIIGKPVEYPRDFNTNHESRERFKALLKHVKSEYKIIRDTQAKPTILGVGLGLGPKKMYWTNRERFDKKSNMMVGIKDESQSKKLQGIIKELLPELFLFQERIKELAFRQTYLISLWGFIRWFFDVRGEDGEAAIAFLVQGHSHGMLRWVIRRLEDNVLFEGDTVESDIIPIYIDDNIKEDYPKNKYISANEKFHFINTIHDSLLPEPWEDEVSLCIQIYQKVMETPCLVLADKKVCPDGLVVRTEATYGENWCEWDAKTNPNGMKLWGT